MVICCKSVVFDYIRAGKTAGVALRTSSICFDALIERKATTAVSLLVANTQRSLLELHKTSVSVNAEMPIYELFGVDLGVCSVFRGDDWFPYVIISSPVLKRLSLCAHDSDFGNCSFLVFSTERELAQKEPVETERH